MSAFLEIQPFVTADDTLDSVCNARLWQNGLSVYFSEKIPYSWETGYELSGFLVDNLIKDFYRKPDREQFSVLHMMAGSGYLVLHCLDSLRQKNPHVFSKIHFFLQDTRETLLQFWTQNEVFKVFKDKVTFFSSFLDATTAIRPDFILAVNGLSLFSSQQFHRQDGKLYSVLWRTLVPENGLFWMLQPQMKKVSVKHIKTMLEEAQELPFLLLKTIVMNQKKEFGHVRVVPESGVDPRIALFIRDRFKHISEGDGYFTFSIALLQFLEFVGSCDPADTTLWFYDHCFTESLIDSCHNLQVNYGLHRHHSVFKPFILDYLNEKGFDLDSTPNILSSKRLEAADIQPQVAPLMENDTDAHVYFSQKTALFQSLTPNQSRDFFINLKVAYALLERGLDEEARQHLYWLSTDYEHLSLPANLLLSRLNRAHYDDRTILDQLKSFAPYAETYYPFYLEIIPVFLKRNLIDDALFWLKKAISKTTVDFHALIPILQQCSQYPTSNPDHQLFLSSVRDCLHDLHQS